MRFCRFFTNKYREPVSYLHLLGCFDHEQGQQVRRLIAVPCERKHASAFWFPSFGVYGLYEASCELFCYELWKRMRKRGADLGIFDAFTTDDVITLCGLSPLRFDNRVKPWHRLVIYQHGTLDALQLLAMPSKQASVHFMAYMQRAFAAYCIAQQYKRLQIIHRDRHR